jgi:hypothetical protein
MTAKYIDFRESMTMELTDFIQSQAGLHSRSQILTG